MGETRASDTEIDEGWNNEGDPHAKIAYHISARACDEAAPTAKAVVAPPELVSTDVTGLGDIAVVGGDVHFDRVGVRKGGRGLGAHRRGGSHKEGWGN